MTNNAITTTLRNGSQGTVHGLPASFSQSLECQAGAVVTGPILGTSEILITGNVVILIDPLEKKKPSGTLTVAGATTLNGIVKINAATSIVGAVGDALNIEDMSLSDITLPSMAYGAYDMLQNFLGGKTEVLPNNSNSSGNVSSYDDGHIILNMTFTGNVVDPDAVSSTAVDGLNKAYKTKWRRDPNFNGHQLNSS